MMSRMNGTDGPALALNIGAFVAACLAINAAIFGLGLSGGTSPTAGMVSLPGWMVGLVWVGLFAAMGAARWYLSRSGGDGARLRYLVVLLALFCLAYPIYTAGLSSVSIGLVGNMLTALAAIFVAAKVWPRQRESALLIAPVAFWVSFASIGLVQMLTQGA